MAECFCTSPLFLEGTVWCLEGQTPTIPWPAEDGNAQNCVTSGHKQLPIYWQFVDEPNKILL